MPPAARRARSASMLAEKGHGGAARQALARAAALAVSLEPTGGSPTGEPTGPVLYVGKLPRESWRESRGRGGARGKGAGGGRGGRGGGGVGAGGGGVGGVGGGGGVGGPPSPTTRARVPARPRSGSGSGRSGRLRSKQGAQSSQLFLEPQHARTSGSAAACAPGLVEPNTAICATPNAAATCIRPESLLDHAARRGDQRHRVHRARSCRRAHGRRRAPSGDRLGQRRFSCRAEQPHRQPCAACSEGASSA